MIRAIHYMVRRPDSIGELIYPIELIDPRYQAYGSFFADGRHPDDLDDTYLFHAARDGALMTLKLQRISVASFATEVEDIGQFHFTATRIGVPARYHGQYPFPKDNLLIRQFAPRDRNLLERAAFEHDFYFIGFSPQISDETGFQPTDPKPPESARTDRRDER